MPSHMDAAGGFQTGREVEWRPQRQRTQVHWCYMQGAKLTPTAEVWTRLSFKVVHTLRGCYLAWTFCYGCRFAFCWQSGEHHKLVPISYRLPKDKLGF
jgi:hypothetical protein